MALLPSIFAVFRLPQYKSMRLETVLQGIQVGIDQRPWYPRGYKNGTPIP